MLEALVVTGDPGKGVGSRVFNQHRRPGAWRKCGRAGVSMAKPRSEWGDARLVQAVHDHLGGYLFHLADMANLPSIDEHGLLSAQEATLKGITPLLPGGSQLTQALDRQNGLADYVFLSFSKAFLMPKDDAVDRHRRPILIQVEPEILFEPGVKVGLGRGGRASRFNAMRAFYEMDWEIGLNEQARTGTGWKARWNTFLDYEILVPKCVPRSSIIGYEPWEIS